MNSEEWKPNFKEVADRYIRRTIEGKSEQELEEASENFAEYLSVIWEMQNRLESHGLDFSKQETDEENRHFLCKSCCPSLEEGRIRCG